MKRREQPQMLAIKQAAAATGLSVDTLRYYEKQGLIIEPARSAAGRRRYSSADLEWIRFVVRLRATGLPLGEIRRYATMVRQGEKTLAERCELLLKHERDLAKRVRELHAAHAEIRRVIGRYRRALAGAELDLCGPLHRRMK